MEVEVNDSESKGDVGSFVPWNNPDNVVTLRTFLALENVLTCYVNPVFFCIGVPANVLNCVVFFRQGYYILPYLTHHHHHYHRRLLCYSHHHHHIYCLVIPLRVEHHRLFPIL